MQKATYAMKMPTHTHIEFLAYIHDTDIQPKQQTADPCLRSQQSVDLLCVETKQFEAYVKSLRIQNTGLSRMLCLGRVVLSLLCYAPHALGDAIF